MFLLESAQNVMSYILQQYIFAKKCGSKEFEDSILKGTGKVVTYTIMTVPPAGFEDLTPYAWVVMELDDF